MQKRKARFMLSAHLCERGKTAVHGLYKNYDDQQHFIKSKFDINLSSWRDDDNDAAPWSNHQDIDSVALP